MNADSKLFRLIFVSPWSLLVFLFFPLLVILNVRFHVPLPFAASAKTLLVNNIFFAVFVACRLLRYGAGMMKGLRYGAGYLRPALTASLPLPIAEVHGVLNRAGYTFAADGGYGEKRDLGYLGTTVLYAGLFILLATGCWDNLRQFSGVLLDGMGPSTSLSKVESYLSINKGPLPESLVSLPKMRIINQYFPDSAFPKGATEVSFLSNDGTEQKYILKPGDPIRYGAFDIYMTKLVFEPQIVIKTRDSKILFDSLVKLNPLVQKRGVYSFYGLFVGNDLGGGVYYQPEKNNLMVVISRGDKKVVTDMVFQVDQQVTEGDYILSCAKMGQWSEIHVVHRRHKGLLLVGAGIAIIGLLLRIAIRPQRVWLEDAAEGCAIRSSGPEAMKLLRDES